VFLENRQKIAQRVVGLFPKVFPNCSFSEISPKAYKMFAKIGVPKKWDKIYL
jgi:hypothetical protein